MAGTDGFGITLTGGTSGAIASILTLEVPGVSRGEIDVTTHSSANGWKEFLPQGIQEVPDTTMTLLFIKAQETVFRTAVNAAAETWTIVQSGSSSTWACSGYVKEIGHDAVAIDDVIKCSVTFGWTGTPSLT